MAVAFGTRYNPHVWGTGVALAASLQLLAVLPPHTPPSLAPVEPMLEFDRTEHPIRQAVLTAPIDHTNGMVRVPDGPGLGLRLIETRLPALRRVEAMPRRLRALSTCLPRQESLHSSLGQ